MAGYTVTALSLDKQKNASHVTIAVSVVDSNGQPVQSLDGSNFAARDIVTGTTIAIEEFHHVGIRGFYRLSLQAEPMTNAREWIIALLVAGRHQEAGRVPQPLNEGQAMVKVRIAEG